MQKMGEHNEKSVKLICGIIEQEDKHVLEVDIQLKYYREAIDAEKKLIKMNQHDHEKTKNEIKEIEIRIGKILFIKKSVEKDQEIILTSLITYQKLEKMTNKEITLKTKEARQIKEEFQNIHNEVKKKYIENPLSRELEDARVSFLKVDIQNRVLEKDRRIKKQIVVQRRAIQKKLYFNFYVNMAVHFLMEKNSAEVRIEKEKELKTFNMLLAAQEEHKMRQKIRLSRDQLKRLPKLTFGSQEVNNDKSNTQVFKIPAQPKPLVQKPIKAVQLEEPQQTILKQPAKSKFNEKLTNMFNEDEPKQAVAAKIKIIEQKVMIPAFVPPVPVKRKKQVALTNVWRKSLKTYRSSQSSSASQESRISTQESQSDHDMSQNSPRMFEPNTSLESQSREYPVPSGLPSQISQTPIMKEPTPKVQVTRAKPMKSILTPQSRAGTGKASMGESSKTVRFNVVPSPVKESSMFTADPTFNQGFAQAMFENAPFIESQMPSENYAVLNNSLMNTSEHGITFEAESTSETYVSPECNYTMEAENEDGSQNQAFGAFSFAVNADGVGRAAGGNEGGDGGIFSFGATKSMFNF
ncbi:uncharacterized protein LOC126737374 [Anthonomus grandis grandis]|uniref:uncharacterized protein LOC126737374 n=1 Tax=Anthonomus grandis grandis TaxID=2921223 RepID=UPI00216699E8|nr:uncharacterized protein LOC126737374 [Anthonomus grandis grandis]